MLGESFLDDECLVLGDAIDVISFSFRMTALGRQQPLFLRSRMSALGNIENIPPVRLSLNYYILCNL